MAIRNIRIYGDGVLEKPCKEVKEVNDRTSELIDDMIETMYDAQGVGLAAPQVGVLKKIAIVDVTTDEEESPLYIMINPRIVEQDGEQLGNEGCLSLPNKVAKVRRPTHVVVEAYDRYMNPIRIEGEGLLARALCHEIDHLDGHMYVEKAETPIVDVEDAEED